jgi:hypothetical protein
MVAILDLRHVQVPGEPYRDSKKVVLDCTYAVERIAAQCQQDWLLIYANLLRISKGHCTAKLDSWEKDGVQYRDVVVHYFDLGPDGW